MANDFADILNHLLEKVNIEEENETITIDDSEKRAEKEVIEQRGENENTESSDINLNLSADSNDSHIDAELDEIIRKATSNENDDQIELNEFDESQLAYLACVCHLLQLAINDAFSASYQVFLYSSKKDKSFH